MTPRPGIHIAERNEKQDGIRNFADRRFIDDMGGSVPRPEAASTLHFARHRSRNSEPQRSRPRLRTGIRRKIVLSTL